MNEWIPCDEKMPENDATVLVTVAFPSDAPKVLEMTYYDGRWYRHDMLISPWWAVVAWMPKPKPYFRQRMSEWIPFPCDEKMPENDATVLVTVAFPSDTPKVFEMSYSNERWYRHDMLISPQWVVIAWMPMPKPYFKGVFCGWAFEEEWERTNGKRESTTRHLT